MINKLQKYSEIYGIGSKVDSLVSVESNFESFILYEKTHGDIGLKEMLLEYISISLAKKILQLYKEYKKQTI